MVDKRLDDGTREIFKKPSLSARFLLWANIVIVLSFVIWAYLSEIDERTQGVGKIIPSSQVQEIQNLEGGILKALYVAEGSAVKKGEPLLQIDDTQFSSTLLEAEVKSAALQAERIRLLAESKSQDSITFPPRLRAKHPEIVANEQALFEINREKLRTEVKTLEQTLSFAKEELAITKPLVEKRIVPQFDLLKLRREINDLEGKIAGTKQGYFTELSAKLVKTNSELKSSQESLASLRDKKQRTTVVSPVDGIVKKINIDTIGGIIRPGDEIMQIVPVGDSLLVSAKVAPSKIAFLRIGQEADVRITAYDPSIYGSLKGKVERISADAIFEKNEQTGREEANYKVVVKTNENYLEYQGEKLPILPGMEANVSILTGKRTILNYILKPILKAKQNALRER